MGRRGVKSYLLDTSLVLRLLTGDPPEVAARAFEVFRGAEDGTYTLAAHPLVVAEAFYTLVSLYKAERAEAAQALLDLLDREGIFFEDEKDLRPALEAAGKGGLSLVDGFLAHRARRQGEGLASLDGRRRKTPRVDLLPP